MHISKGLHVRPRKIKILDILQFFFFFFVNVEGEN